MLVGVRGCAVYVLCAAPGDISSSPTRRSSDLRRLRIVRQLVTESVLLSAAGAVAGAALAAWIGDAVVDRKSTRLNSSHLGISYAVFCLKKQKAEFQKSHPSQRRRSHHDHRTRT